MSEIEKRSQQVRGKKTRAFEAVGALAKKFCEAKRSKTER